MQTKSIYFKDSSPKSKTALKALTTVATKVAPALTLQASKRVLTRPSGKRTVEFKHLLPTHEYKVKTRLGDVHLYYFKGGSTQHLVAHGWADTTQSMESVIINALELGHSVWALDHIGHGKSSGKKSHLFAYIEGLKQVIDMVESVHSPIHVLTGHSSGAAAILNLDKEYLKERKVILMGTPIRFFENMSNKLDELGIHPKVLDDLLEDVSKEFQTDWKKLRPMQHKSKLAENFLFIHDEEDKFCPYADLEVFLMNSSAKSFVTKGLGHRQILWQPRVMQKVSEFLSE